MAKVFLKNVGVMRINILRLIADTLYISIVEAKKLMDSVPVELKNEVLYDISNEEANAIKARFEQLGATIEVAPDEEKKIVKN